MLSHFSHVQLFVTPWTVAHQALLSMGLPRQEYSSGKPSSRVSSQPRDRTHVSYISCSSRQVLYHWYHRGDLNKDIVEYKKSLRPYQLHLEQPKAKMVKKWVTSLSPTLDTSRTWLSLFPLVSHCLFTDLAKIQDLLGQSLLSTGRQFII